MSPGPPLVPPVTTTRSDRRALSSSTSRSGSGSSAAMPTRIACAPASRAAAVSAYELASTTWPAEDGTPALDQLVPGGDDRDARLRPDSDRGDPGRSKLADQAGGDPVARRREQRAGRQLGAGAPHVRLPAECLADLQVREAVVGPGGGHDRVGADRQGSTGGDREARARATPATVCHDPARRSPTTGSRTGLPGAAPTRSSARTAYPSMAAVSYAGSAEAAVTSDTSTPPCASRSARSSGRSGRTPARSPVRYSASPGRTVAVMPSPGSRRTRPATRGTPVRGLHGPTRVARRP